MLVHQALRFEVDPGNRQRAALASHVGAARFAYNWGLRLVKEHLDARRALTVLALRQGASAGQAEVWAAELGGPVPWSSPALQRRWNRDKPDVAPWWAENSKEAYKSGLDALARALKGFSASRSGQRRGKRVGFPRFKSKSARASFRVTTGSFGVVDERHVRLPRIGRLRTKEPTGKLARRLADGTARVLSATISVRASRWWVSFTCEVERQARVPVRPDGVVGVDIGVRSLAALSTGEVVPTPKHLERYRRHMARLQRQCSRRRGPAKGQAASKRWRRSQAKLARAHARVADARSDGLHKLTTRLARVYGAVVVEDLHVAGMTTSARGSGRRGQKAALNRAVLNASPARLRRQLAYKCAWYGSRLVVADRWFASSKICSGCGAVKAKLALSERTFRCEACGLVMDRDHNAAVNLAFLVEAARGTASGAATGRATGPRAGRSEVTGPGQCASSNCEDGAAQGDKTATASSQGGAASDAMATASEFARARG